MIYTTLTVFSIIKVTTLQWAEKESGQLSQYSEGLRWKALVRFPSVQDFSLLHGFQTGPGAHLASYLIGTGRPFPEADHSLPSSAEIKNGGAIPPLRHISS
jgi:hypothetical protein